LAVSLFFSKTITAVLPSNPLGETDFHDPKTFSEVSWQPVIPSKEITMIENLLF
jgi:hypothetical protein